MPDPALIMALLSLMGSLGSVVALVLGSMNISSKIRASGVEFGEYRTKTDTMWALYLESAKTEARRAGGLQRRSPEQLDPEVARHFAHSDLGPRLRAFYRGLLAKNPTLTEPDATWQIYVAFRQEWQPKIMTPLDIDLGRALVYAYQFCVDNYQKAER